MRLLKINILLIICLVGSTSLAIRSVGNGGGLAEMRMIYFHLNLSRFLDTCLNSKGHCGLNQSEQSDWRFLSQTNSVESEKYQVDFKPHVNEKLGFHIENQKIIIGSDHLYDSNGDFKSFNQLLSLMLSIRFEMNGAKNSFETNLKKLSQIFAQFNFSDFQYQVPNVNGLFRLSILSLESKEKIAPLIVIEDFSSSYDLNENTSLALPCGQLSDWTFDQWESSTSGRRIYLYSQGSASCLQDNQSRQILIEFDIEKNELIKPESILIRFFAN